MKEEELQKRKTFYESRDGTLVASVGVIRTTDLLGCEVSEDDYVAYTYKGKRTSKGPILSIGKIKYINYGGLSKVLVSDIYFQHELSLRDINDVMVVPDEMIPAKFRE